MENMKKTKPNVVKIIFKITFAAILIIGLVMMVVELSKISDKNERNYINNSIEKSKNDAYLEGYVNGYTDCAKAYNVDLTKINDSTYVLKIKKK